MKKIKLFLCVALFGAMSFGAFSVYEHYTMSAEERALLENVEALTSGEGGSSSSVSFGCTGISPTTYCFYRCSGCQTLYQSSSTGDTRTNLRGTCDCGTATK